MPKKRTRRYHRDPKIRNGLQTNLTLPIDWIKEIEKKARQFSHQENRDISRNDLIRRVLKDVFNLKDEKILDTNKNNE